MLGLGSSPCLGSGVGPWGCASSLPWPCASLADPEPGIFTLIFSSFSNGTVKLHVEISALENITFLMSSLTAQESLRLDQAWSNLGWWKSLSGVEWDEL